VRNRERERQTDRQTERFKGVPVKEIVFIERQNEADRDRHIDLVLNKQFS